MNASTSSTDSRRLWHHIPQLPVQLTPWFDWPPRPAASLKWLLSLWRPVGLYTGCVALAAVIYFGFQPETAVMQTFSASWIFQIWIRNLILLSAVAGALHLYLYTFKKQKNNLKFEEKDPSRNSKTHSFGNQTLDNMFWSLGSGVTIWTAYESVYYWAGANSYIPVLSFTENPLWFVLMFFVISVWSSFHFYWVHRFLHWPPLYKVAHALHHRNVNIGPWSGISMHPVEHLIYFSSFAIHFVVASHPLHFLYHAYFQGIGPSLSHSGYEELQVQGKNRMALGVFFHQLHHKFFKCNYGTVEMPWDRWFGSFHDGTEEATRRIRKRRW